MTEPLDLLPPSAADAPGQSLAEPRDELTRRFRVHRGAVQRIVDAEGGAALVRTAPNLTWLVAAALDEHGAPALPIAWMLRAPRRSLLAFALGLDRASPTMVRAAERVLLDRYDASELELLRFALRRPTVLAAAARLHRWSVRDLGFLVRVPGLATHPLLPELIERIAAGDGLLYRRVQRWILDTSRRSRALGHADPSAFLNRIRTVRDLERVHDRVLDAYLDRVPFRIRGPEYGGRIHRRTDPVAVAPPPLEGTLGITPLRTFADYEELARGFGERYLRLAYEAARGEVAVYWVDVADRGVVVVDLTGPVPFIRALEKPGYGRIGEDEWHRVHRWLEERR